LKIKAGNVLTADLFYRDSMDIVKKLAENGVLAVEMETTALYSIAAKYGVNALSILTVSDHIFTGEETSAEERQTTFNDMIEMALEVVSSEQ
jgi:purine-nucleoside phosphorylase